MTAGLTTASNTIPEAVVTSRLVGLLWQPGGCQSGQGGQAEGTGRPGREYSEARLVQYSGARLVQYSGARLRHSGARLRHSEARLRHSEARLVQYSEARYSTVGCSTRYPYPVPGTHHHPVPRHPLPPGTHHHCPAWHDCPAH